MRSGVQTTGLILIAAAFILHFLRPILPIERLLPPAPYFGTGIGWPFLIMLAGGLVFMLGSLLPKRTAPLEPAARAETPEGSEPRGD